MTTRFPKEEIQITNKFMKNKTKQKNSISYQRSTNNTTRRYHLIPGWISAMKNQKLTNADKDV
jgi:hypothetical protein